MRNVILVCLLLFSLNVSYSQSFQKLVANDNYNKASKLIESSIFTRDEMWTFSGSTPVGITNVTKTAHIFTLSTNSWAQSTHNLRNYPILMVISINILPQGSYLLPKIKNLIQIISWFIITYTS